MPAAGNMDEENDGLEDLSPEERERVLKKRRLIRDGMGGALGGGMGGEEDDTEIEYTPSGTPSHHSMPARVDERTYASDEEDYDSDDQVVLGVKLSGLLHPCLLPHIAVSVTSNVKKHVTQ